MSGMRQSVNSIPEIDQNFLELDDEPLGSGYFGSVYRGRLKNEQGPMKYALVAAKMLHDPERHTIPVILQHLNKELYEEVRIMSRIGYHENILQLIGTTRRGDQLCMVTELCSLGSLDKFLRSAKNTFMNEIVQYCWNRRRTIYKAEEDENWGFHFEQRRIAKILTTSDLICFAYQIANGMEYVHSKEVVHRDLALRNVLLTSDYVVKIGDFGLSRRTNRGLYEKCQNPPLPFKWTAPEAFFSNSVPITSDLYTFGILLWELFTLGEMPYEQLKNIHEVLNFVVSEQKVMNKPPYAPDEMYNLMKSLWNLTPALRTSLKQCKRYIFENLNVACPTLALRFEVSTIVSGYQQPDKCLKNFKIQSPSFTYVMPAEIGGVSILNRQRDKELTLSTNEQLETSHASHDPASNGPEFQSSNSSDVSSNEFADESQETSDPLPSLTPSQIELESPQPEAENRNGIVKRPTRRKQSDCLIKKCRWILITICCVFILAAIILAVVIGTTINVPKNQPQPDFIETTTQTWKNESKGTSQLGSIETTSSTRNYKPTHQPQLHSIETTSTWNYKPTHQPQLDSIETTTRINANDPEAQNKLGDKYFYGEGVSQSHEEAVKWYRGAAEQGNAEGQWKLGAMYQNGWGVGQSFEEAVKWYRKAAEQGHGRGQNSLGFMYHNGLGVDKSYEEAVKWYGKAAQQGNVDGQYNLGLMYENGWGVDQSNEEAVKWYRKAAEQGNANGQYRLGLMYLNGWGVNKSNEEAVKWISKAAEQGHADGQSYLKYMNEKGQGEEDLNSEHLNEPVEGAEQWYRKIAEQGNAAGQNNLRTRYQTG